MGEAGVIVGGDVVAEEGYFVSGFGLRDVGDVDGGEVHGDAADDWGLLIVDQNPAAGFDVGAGELASEAVGVADREEGDAHGFGCGVGCVVADGVAGGDVFQSEDAGLPGEDGFEDGLEFWMTRFG